jgi:hypothetical protein
MNIPTQNNNLSPHFRDKFLQKNSEEIYYLDDGRKLKGTYDQQNDKYNWADSGKWM